MSGTLIAAAVRAAGHPAVEFIPELRCIGERLLSEVRAGDLVLTAGAGDVWRVADDLLCRLRVDAGVEARDGFGD